MAGAFESSRPTISKYNESAKQYGYEGFECKDDVNDDRGLHDYLLLPISSLQICGYEATYDERGTDDSSQDDDTEHSYLLRFRCLAQR
jgi:hypothetical protein